jgi:hypothetical protein
MQRRPRNLHLHLYVGAKFRENRLADSEVKNGNMQARMVSAVTAFASDFP